MCGAKALISFSLHPLPLPLLQPIFSLPRRHECVSNAPLKIWLGLWKKLQQFEVLKISCRTMRLRSAESNPWPEQFLILSVSGKYASPFWKKQNFSSEASARPPILSKRKCTPSPTGTMTRSPCDRKPPRRSSGLHRTQHVRKRIRYKVIYLRSDVPPRKAAKRSIPPV